MQVFISGKHLEIGAALQEYVEAELQSSVKKYFEHAISANVVFSKVRHLFHVEVHVNEGTGQHSLMKSSAEDDGVYSAFDIALTKIEKQLRRYKRRIKDHHKSRLDKEGLNLVSATKYVLSPTDDEEQPESSDVTPLIIAEKTAEIECLTVSDAVMRMDLGQLPALMFINKKSGAMNVVYRREDGHISWIDSAGSHQQAA